MEIFLSFIYPKAASRTYFYNRPDESTKRSAYLTPTGEVITALNDENGFIYTEFTNRQGLTSRGWIKKSDLVPLQYSNRNLAKPDSNASVEETDNSNQQLNDAREFLERGEIKQALFIYSDLAQKEIPEAMYQYGNLALKNQNPDIDCSEGLSLVQKAAAKGYVPAKKTLGFLYVFAENPQILGMNDYGYCPVERN